MDILENAVSYILNVVWATILAIWGRLGASSPPLLGSFVIALATLAYLAWGLRKHPQLTEKDIHRIRVVAVLGGGASVEGRQVTGVGVVEHDEVGAQALRELGFSDDVADIVSGHVAAKRYLVATDKDYASKLSDVSVESLRLQGGPMSAREVQDFTRSPNWQSKVRVRTWDDRAKTPGANVPDLESYRELITAHLSRQQGGD